MPTQNNLIGSGCAPLQAIASVGVFTNTLTATGSTLAGALALPSDFCVVTTTAASTGVRLPNSTLGMVNPGDTYIVVNHGASTLTVYPATAAGKIASGSAGAGVSIPTLKTGWLLNISGDNWAFSVSA